MWWDAREHAKHPEWFEGSRIKPPRVTEPQIVWVLVADFADGHSFLVRAFGHVPSAEEYEHTMAELGVRQLAGFKGSRYQAMEVVG